MDISPQMLKKSLLYVKLLFGLKGYVLLNSPSFRG